MFPAFTFLYFAYEGFMSCLNKEASLLVGQASVITLLVFALSNVCQDFEDQVNMPEKLD